jgi:hypothetical protein
VDACELAAGYAGCGWWMVAQWAMVRTLASSKRSPFSRARGPGWGAVIRTCLRHARAALA